MVPPKQARSVIVLPDDGPIVALGIVARRRKRVRLQREDALPRLSVDQRGSDRNLQGAQNLVTLTRQQLPVPDAV